MRKNPYIYIIVLLISACSSPRHAEKLQAEKLRDKTRVIAYNTKTISKRIGESELGNLLADALLAKAKSYSKQPVDFAVLHWNEIYVPQLPQGNITVENIYEMIPSDNEIVLLELGGKSTKELFDYMASGGGIPIAGVRYVINNQKAENVEISGTPFDETKTYTLAVSDYWVNESSQPYVLKWVKKTSSMKLLRDAILEYLEEHKSITGNKDDRVSVKMR